MKELECKIVGISPLMMYRYIHGYNPPKIVDDVRAECALRLHTVMAGSSIGLKEGTIVVPQEAIYRSLMNGGKFKKLGMKKVTTEKSSLMPGYVTIPGFEFPLEYKGWEADIRTAVTGRGDRVPVYRPRIDEWSLTFRIWLQTPGVFGVDLMRRIVDHAGPKVGLLSFRPEKKGGFGMFRVDKWAVI